MVFTASMKNTLATAYATAATYGALSTGTVPGSSPGTEVTGGSPAYARIHITAGVAWGTASAGATTAGALSFNVPGGPTTVTGFEIYDAATTGNYLDGCTITSQTFSSQGTYAITPTYTQS